MRFPSIKFNNIHKRTGFVFLAMSGLSLLIAFVMLLAASYGFDAIAQNGMMNVTISSTGTNIGLLGSGVNLIANPSTNFLDDASFEPHIFREVFTLEAGDAKTMVVSNDQAQPGVYGEGFFIGASVRVTANNENGIVLKKTGTITRYSPNQIGGFEKSPIIGDIPSGAKINDYTTKAGVTITVGEKGTIIKGIDTQSPTMQYAETASNFTSIDSNKENFFACSTDGRVISSMDGMAWTAWEIPAGIELNAIAASDTMVVAVGNSGVILIGSGGVLYNKEIGVTEDITDITYGNGMFIAVTSDGNILYSTSGLLWKQKTEKHAAAYTRIEYGDTLFALLTDTGEVLIFSSIEEDPAKAADPLAVVVDVTVMSKSKILYLTDNNKIYQSSDQGITWEESRITPPEDANLIGAIGDEEILCSSIITNSYISRLVTEIEIDSDLTEGEYQAGYLCYIDMEYASLPSNYLDTSSSNRMKDGWMFSGSGKAQKMIAEGAPYDGVGVMQLTSNVNAGSTYPYAVISQSIASDETYGLFATKTFYTFSMWVRQAEGSSGNLKVWISGPFDPIGTEFTNIGTTWKKVTFKFLIPPEVTAQEAAQAVFNVGTEDKSVFYFDKAYLGLTSENEENYPAAYIAQLQEIAPTAVRLDFLKLGAKTAMTNRWAQNSNLDKALNLVLDCGATSNPWIVIDSYMGESELRNLIEYLAGSISTTYGVIRLQNGSPLPWSGRYNKILVEFIDSDNNFKSDVARAVYVNKMIEIIESTPYYKNIKSKMVFVDGMQYEEGIMLSNADHTTSDFTCTISEATRYESIMKALTDYSTNIPRSADRPTGLPISLMRSITFTDPEFVPTVAELITILLDEMGIDIDASMISMESWTTTEWSKVESSAAMIASKIGQGEFLTVTKTQIGSNESQVDCYAYKDNNIVSLVFASHNSTPVAISLDIAYSLKDATLTRFDTDGEIVEDIVLRSSDKKFNIMPENAVLIQLTVED